MMNEPIRHRFPSERRRVLVATAVGVAAGSAVALFAPWQLSLLVGWDAISVTLVAWVWGNAAGMGSAALAEVATAEDNSRDSTRLLLLAAALTSLIGVAVATMKAKTQTSGLDALMTAV